MQGLTLWSPNEAPSFVDTFLINIGIVNSQENQMSLQRNSPRLPDTARVTERDHMAGTTQCIQGLSADDQAIQAQDSESGVLTGQQEAHYQHHTCHPFTALNMKEIYVSVLSPWQPSLDPMNLLKSLLEPVCVSTLWTGLWFLKIRVLKL